MIYSKKNKESDSSSSLVVYGKNVYHIILLDDLITSLLRLVKTFRTAYLLQWNASQIAVKIKTQQT